jgi:hypothetical protein
LDAAQEGFIFTQLISGNGTFGALPIVHAGDQGLLRVITNKDGNNGMAAFPYSIAAPHWKLYFTI